MDEGQGSGQRDLGVVLVAAGSSSRMGFDKIWSDLNGEPLLAQAVRRALAAGPLEVIVVVAAGQVERAGAAFPEARVVPGGGRRRDSVAAGLAVASAEWIAVHDAARAFAPSDLYGRGLRAARPTGAAIPVMPLKDTVKQVDAERGQVLATLPRAGLGAVQTPQVFRRDVLAAALALTDEDVTDEATLVERLGVTVATFPGREESFKVTTPLDFALARLFLAGSDAALPA